MEAARIRHEGCRTCGEDLAKYPERPCSRCQWRYHAECFESASGCINPECVDPLFAFSNLPAVRETARVPVMAARKATCPRRAAAFVLDSAVALSSLAAGITLGHAFGMGHLAAQGMALTFGFATVFTNDILLNGIRGASVGKKAVGIKIVTEDGAPPGIARAFMREGPGKILSYSLKWGGFLMAAIDPETRALHDRLTGTWVIEAEPGT